MIPRRRVSSSASAEKRGADHRERHWYDPVVEVFWWAGLAAALGGLFLLMTASVEDRLAAFALVPLLALVSVLLLRALVPAPDLKFLRRILVAGILIRLGLAVLIHTQFPAGFFAPDQFTYQDVGWRTLQWFQGLGPQPAQIVGGGEVGYFYWNAFLFDLFGFAPLAPKIVNCFLGAWLGVLAYRIGAELAGLQVGRSSAVLVTFFPSLILWSAHNIRDTMVLFVIAVAMLLTIRLRKHPSFPRILLIAAVLVLLGLLRDYMAVMMVFTLVGSFFISSRRQVVLNLMLGLAILGLAVLAYRQLGLGDRWLTSADFETLNVTRRNLAVGGTAFQPGVDISDPLRGIQFLPIGMAFFILAPFPWQFGSVLSVMSLPEQIIWYGLLPFVGIGSMYLIRHYFALAEPVLLFVLVTSVIYALVEGNAGTAYRHRAQIVMFMLILGAVGIELVRARRLERADAAARRKVVRRNP